MTLAPYAGVRPTVSSSAWIAATAVLTGDVRVGDDATVWFGVVARGDIEAIEIASEANIQDACVLHTDPGQPLRIGPRAVIGHAAVLHGCVIGEEALVGMGARVLSGAIVGKGAVIGACALVLEHQQIPAGALAVGVPARVLRVGVASSAREIARDYRERAREYERAI